jgi:hypothetical protein
MKNMNKRRSRKGCSNSGFKGVYRKGERWQSKFNLNGKDTHIGIFDSKEDAAKHYDWNMLQHYTDCYLNFPDFDYSKFKPVVSNKKTHKLNYKKAEMLRRDRESGVSPKELAKKYDISLTSVYRVLGRVVYQPIDCAKINVIYSTGT